MKRYVKEFAMDAMKKTKIDWCDSTWNQVAGCLHERKYSV